MTTSPNTIERVAETGAYVGGATSFALWGLSAADIAVLCSALFAGLSFGVHLYFSWRRDRREQERHERHMSDPSE
jgi:hypothetical protein